MNNITPRVALLITAVIVFAITAFCAFTVSSVSTPHLIGGLAVGGVLVAAAWIPA